MQKNLKIIFKKENLLSKTDGINLNNQYEKRFDISTKKIYKFNKKKPNKKVFSDDN